MSNRTFWKYSFLAASALAFAVFYPLVVMVFAGHAAGRPPGQLSFEMYDKLAAIRACGLNGDRSQIPAMIELAEDHHPHCASTGLHALASLGATEALPTIDYVIAHRNAGYPYVQIIARVCRARLLAEAEAAKLTDPREQARTKVQRFLRELELNPIQINRVVSTFHTARRLGATPAWPLEQNAMNEIASMVYSGAYDDYKDIPEINALDFTQDPGSEVKIRYARLPKEQRLSAMIDELGAQKEETENTDYLTQLIADYGLPASNLIAAKLQEIDTHREKYKAFAYGSTYYVGFRSLCHALEAIGDRGQLPLLEHYAKDKEWGIGGEAEMARRRIQTGYRRPLALDY